MTTQTEVQEISIILTNLERDLAKARRKISGNVRAIIGRGDAAALPPLVQRELQALIPAVLSDAEHKIVLLHQRLTGDAQQCGIDIPGPPSSDDDVSIFSSGGR